MSSTPALVSTEWLQEHLGDPAVRVLDASWYLPSKERDARGEYAVEHIPGARFFDLDEVSDPSTDLPHMLPSAEAFAEAVGALGVGNAHHVVVYDGDGVYSSPRAWWMFRVFGHDRVSVLDGGFRRWKSELRPVSNTAPDSSPQRFVAELQPDLLRTLDQMREAVDDAAQQILDARPEGRFLGLEDEPRPGVRRGHIPRSLNLPFERVLNPDGTLRPTEELKRLLASLGLDLARPVTTSCGSGVTASLVALALYQVGKEDAAVYDGSWAEWGSQPDGSGGLTP